MTPIPGEISQLSTKASLFLMVLAVVGGVIAYHNYTQPDVVISRETLNQAGVLGAGDIDEIVDASRHNEVRFDSHFKRHLFSATGKLASANPDGGHYYVRAVTPAGSVGCTFSDKARAAPLADAPIGAPIQIGGFIDDTWLGTVLLKDCNFWLK
jgi:hypothetical protein